MDEFNFGSGSRVKSESEAEKRSGIRQAKNQQEVVVVRREQSKFFVDASQKKASLELILAIFERANKEEYGRPITFKGQALADPTQNKKAFWQGAPLST